MQTLINQWMYAPWLHHSDAEAYLASADAEIARLRSELVRHAPGQDGRHALLTVNTLTHLSFDMPPAQRVQNSCVKASECALTL